MVDVELGLGQSSDERRQIHGPESVSRSASNIEPTTAAGRNASSSHGVSTDFWLINRTPAIAISPTTQEMTSSPGRAPDRSTVPDRIASPVANRVQTVSTSADATQRWTRSTCTVTRVHLSAARTAWVATAGLGGLPPWSLPLM